MENIIHNIPAMIPLLLPAVLILMVVTNIITEVLKKLTWEKMPTNLLAFLVAMAVTLLAFFALCQITSTPITWYMVAGAVVLGIFVAYAAISRRAKNSTRYKFPEQIQEIWYLVLVFLVLIQFVMVSKWPAVVSKAIHEIQCRIVRLLLLLLDCVLNSGWLRLEVLQQIETGVCWADRNGMIEPGPDGFQHP